MLLGMVLNLLSSETIHAWTVGENHATTEMAAVQSRRKWLKQVSVAVTTTTGMLAGSTAVVHPARAVQEESAALCYFGVGCFWHVQHELWKAEQQLLGRSVQECTALAGYAGGKKVGKDGTVCYHNFLGQSDYGKLGHSEVVALTIPDQKLESIARAYFDLFVNGERADPQDAGSEYRCVQISILTSPCLINPFTFSNMSSSKFSHHDSPLDRTVLCVFLTRFEWLIISDPCDFMYWIL
jgi:hypothetical protein